MSANRQRDFDPEQLFRISYASEPGDTLKDLGSGQVLIRHKGREDRILDRNTGEVTPISGAQVRRLLRDVFIVLSVGFVIAAVAFGCMYFS